MKYAICDLGGIVWLNNDMKSWTSGDRPGQTTKLFDDRDEAFEFALTTTVGARPFVHDVVVE